MKQNNNQDEISHKRAKPLKLEFQSSEFKLILYWLGQHNDGSHFFFIFFFNVNQSGSLSYFTQAASAALENITEVVWIQLNQKQLVEHSPQGQREMLNTWRRQLHRHTISAHCEVVSWKTNRQKNPAMSMSLVLSLYKMCKMIIWSSMKLFVPVHVSPLHLQPLAALFQRMCRRPSTSICYSLLPTTPCDCTKCPFLMVNSQKILFTFRWKPERLSGKKVCWTCRTLAMDILTMGSNNMHFL